MLDKKTYKKIFKRAEHYYKIDNKRNDLLDNLWNVLNPSAYSPIIETGLLEAYMDALSITYGEDIIDSMHYYFYEAKDMATATCKANGKKYNAKNLDEYIDFLLVTNDNSPIK